MNPAERLTQPTHLYPQNPTLFNYLRILGFPAKDITGELRPPSGHAPIVLRGLLNSFILSVIVTPITLIISLTVAYAMVRLNFPLKRTWLFSIITARSYPPFAILIPFFILFQKICLYGTYTGLVILNLTVTVPMVIWLMTTFFENLPVTLEKEARIDGCTRFEAFYRIIVPISKPGIVASATIAFLTVWNEFTFGLLIGAGTPIQPFAPSVAGILSVEMGAGDPTEAAAAMILGLIPSLILAYIYQRYMRQLNVVQPL
jgi:multiple sugar transport system permease protein